ncbi:MAG: putative DNA modification/repair radical SAM protein [Deltaproteobacteria bacterium]|jgi:putative DNA modification/repair radical SAM protein|nr:putative DNA modification/repair radical SAM protein [Deltaproteobacteria bacterium]
MDQMMNKIAILANSAKYDASCASSGSRRRKSTTGLGRGQVNGICHSWSADGRCISLLKLLYSNICRYDCAYCINRRSNDLPRTSLTPGEVADITVNFYRRNYIEGLFLSTAVFDDPDTVMEELIACLKLLRQTHRFGGYIHLKIVPGADPLLVAEAGRYADRVSVNIELPSASSLSRLAPEKTQAAILGPMRQASQLIASSRQDRHHMRRAPTYAPAGQSTQVIIGASPETDRTILSLSEQLYRDMSLRRIYYSAYMPVSPDNRLPQLATPPLRREHRLYQADWLLRFYGFRAAELLDEARPNFNLDLDPKSDWALRHLEQFPVDVNHADYLCLLRVPGLGVRSARRIIKARRVAKLSGDDLGKLGVVMKRARWFLIAQGRYLGEGPCREDRLYRQLSAPSARPDQQLELFAKTANEERNNAITGEL